MVKASTVPKHRRQLLVTRSAISAARDFTRLKYAQHSDGDLSKIIDEAVDLKNLELEVADTSGGEVLIPGARCEKTLIISVAFEDVPGQLFAVVRDGSVITLLDRSKVNLNLGNGKWRQLVNGQVAPRVAPGSVDRAPPPRPPLAVVPPPPGVEIVIPQPIQPIEAVAPRDPDREEFVVNIPLDLAAFGVRLVEAEIQFCRAQIADDNARAAAAVTAVALEAARREAARTSREG